MRIGILIIVAILTGCKPAENASMRADVFLIVNNKSEQNIGQVMFRNKNNSLEVSVDLKGLPVGEHGFHIHENPSCEPGVDAKGIMVAAQKAGGHYDPEHTDKHLGPNQKGHKGDMPVLNVGKNGEIKTTFLLSDLTAEEIKNRSVVVHAGGDNYADEPMPLGGGGARIACGIIK